MRRNGITGRSVATRRIATHDMAPSTCSARRRLDRPRTWFESALERRAAGLPLLSVAFRQGLASRLK